MTTAIERAAGFLADAKTQLLEAEAIQDAARAKATAIRAKISDAENARGLLVRRRQADGANDRDAAEFAVLSADLDLLREMLIDAQDALKAATTDQQQAIVATAERDFNSVSHRAEFDALQAKAAEIDALYVRCIAELFALGKAHMSCVTLSAAWRPSSALQQAVVAGRVPTP